MPHTAVVRVLGCEPIVRKSYGAGKIADPEIAVPSLVDGTVQRKSALRVYGSPGYEPTMDINRELRAEIAATLCRHHGKPSAIIPTC